MDWFLFLGPAVKLGFMALGLLMIIHFLRWLDRQGRLDWRAIYALILSEPRAAATYFGARLIAAALLVGQVVGAILIMMVTIAPAAAGPLIPSTYDRQIRAAAETHLPGLPWTLYKAQLFQESRLKPDARSPVGAEGIAQFMPATWAEVSKAMGYGLVDRRMAEPSIAAGAFYMATLRKRWGDIGDLERHRFAAGGYNAGNGSIGRARRACDGSPSWAVVAGCLPEITGRHAVETTTYVDRIWRWWAMLEGRA